MKVERPRNALFSRSETGRMRTSSEGPWVRRSDYEDWRNYALALESKLNGMLRAASPEPHPDSQADGEK